MNDLPILGGGAACVDGGADAGSGHPTGLSNGRNGSQVNPRPLAGSKPQHGPGSDTGLLAELGQGAAPNLLAQQVVEGFGGALGHAPGRSSENWRKKRESPVDLVGEIGDKCDMARGDLGHQKNKSPDRCPTYQGGAATGASPEPVRNETVNHATAPRAVPAIVNPSPRPVTHNCDPAAHLDGIGFHCNGNVCSDGWVEDAVAFIEAYGLPCTHERAQAIVDADQERHWLAWDAQTIDERRENHALRGV